MSIRFRMLVVLASVAIASAGVTSVMSYDTARQAIEQQSFDMLTAVREMKSNQIEDYARQIVDQILTLAESRMIVDAMNELRTAFHAIEEESALESGELARRDQRLRQYYQEQFLSRLSRYHGGGLAPFAPVGRYPA